MHFFNPPPVMALLEVVAGERVLERGAGGRARGRRGDGQARDRRRRRARASSSTAATGRSGSRRCKLLQERVATFEQIDRICRLGGGFRMGPFELMDLVGVDVGLDVSRSFYEQSFGEPRWRPSPITVRTVAAGRLGRKSGRGYYDYAERPGDHRPADPGPAAAGGGDGRDRDRRRRRRSPTSCARPPTRRRLGRSSHPDEAEAPRPRS